MPSCTHVYIAGYIINFDNTPMGIKYSVNEQFFDHWSHEMAYVLGFLYADGSMENAPYLRGKYVRVSNTDKDRIELIREFMESRHTIVKTPPIGNRKAQYLLRIGSHALYDRLHTIGMTPHKSLTMKFPAAPRKNLPAFVRGYFDGDGCVTLNQYKTPAGSNVNRLVVIFTSGSKKFLCSLHERIYASTGIVEHALHQHSKHGAYQLRYSIRSCQRLFPFLYSPPLSRGLYLRRKYAIFARYFKERPDLVTHEVRRTLKRVNGLVVKKQTRRSAKPLYEGANPSQASTIND